MGQVYMMIGNGASFDESASKPPEGALELVTKEEDLDATYKEFLGECYEASVEDASARERPVVSLLEEIAKGASENTKHEVFVFDRARKHGARYSLENNMSETGLQHSYQARHDVQGSRQELKTLEVYVLSEEAGGC